jgi:mRNA interferase MazF
LTRGKVVLVPFPFDDLSAVKVRPAVCLTEPLGRYRHVIVAFVTSQALGHGLPSDLVLHASHPDFARTGRRVASTVRLSRIMTVTTQLIIRELGELSPPLLSDVRQRLMALL